MIQWVLPLWSFFGHKWQKIAGRFFETSFLNLFLKNRPRLKLQELFLLHSPADSSILSAKQPPLVSMTTNPPYFSIVLLMLFTPNP